MEYATIKPIMVLLIGQKNKKLTEYLDANGYNWFLLFDKNNSVAKESKNSTGINFKNIDYEEIAKRIPSNVDRVINTYEQYILHSAKLAKTLKIPGPSIESAEAATNKNVMRELFKNSPIKISPDFTKISSLKDALSFAKNHSFPLIIKPTNLSKSLLVHKCENISDIKNVYSDITRQAKSIYKKYAPNTDPEFLIEEFLEGPMFAVDAYISSTGKVQILENIVDYETGKDIGIDDLFHYSRIIPTSLSGPEVSQIRYVAELGIKSLELRSCPAHVEIVLTKNGPMVMEIGARNGGYRPSMHGLANGIDLFKAMIDNSAGLEVNIKPKKNEYCAVLEIFPEKEGILKKISHLDKLAQLSSYHDSRQNSRPGEKTGRSSKGYKTALRITLHNADRAKFYKDLEIIKNKVNLILE